MPEPQAAGPFETETLYAFFLYDDAKACAESIGILARGLDALVAVTASHLDELTARVEALEKRPSGGCGPAQ